jgi:hypothetical protein
MLALSSKRLKIDPPGLLLEPAGTLIVTDQDINLHLLEWPPDQIVERALGSLKSPCFFDERASLKAFGHMQKLLLALNKLSRRIHAGEQTDQTTASRPRLRLFPARRQAGLSAHNKPLLAAPIMAQEPACLAGL